VPIISIYVPIYARHLEVILSIRLRKKLTDWQTKRGESTHYNAQNGSHLRYPSDGLTFFIGLVVKPVWRYRAILNTGIWVASRNTQRGDTYFCKKAWNLAICRAGLLFRLHHHRVPGSTKSESVMIPYKKQCIHSCTRLQRKSCRLKKICDILLSGEVGFGLMSQFGFIRIARKTA
jgi:hypothetical protein